MKNNNGFVLIFIVIMFGLLVSFSNYPLFLFNTVMVGGACNYEQISLSEISYSLNDGDFASIWKAVISLQKGCEVVTATIPGGAFADGSDIGVDPVNFDFQLNKQGCSAILRKGYASGQQSLQHIKSLVVMDTATAGVDIVLEGAKIGAEKVCSEQVAAQGNTLLAVDHQHDCWLGAFIPCNLVTTCYGFDSADKTKQLGTVSDSDRSVYYEIGARVFNKNFDSGYLLLTENNPSASFGDVGYVKVNTIGRSVQECESFKDVVGVRTTPAIFSSTEKWKLINKFQVDQALTYLANGFPSCVVLNQDTQNVYSCVQNYNKKADAAYYSRSFINLTSQEPTITSLWSPISSTLLKIEKSDVLEPQLLLKLNADWVGIKASSGTPKVLKAVASDGFTSQKIPVKVLVKNDHLTREGFFHVSNVCNGNVSPMQKFGLSPKESKNLVFYNEFDRIMNYKCEIVMTDQTSFVSDSLEYSGSISSSCNKVDEGNWIVNPLTCQLECSVRSCPAGFSLNLVECFCEQYNIIPPPVRDCSRIPNSFWDRNINQCVCGVNDTMTKTSSTTYACQTKITICDSGYSLNSAGTECIKDKSIDWFAVVGALLFVGVVGFIVLPKKMKISLINRLKQIKGWFI